MTATRSSERRAPADTPATDARPDLVPTRAGLAERLAATRRDGRTIVLVPTMGALHEGHASLLRTARERAGADGVVVASVFVNPMQFGQGEDLDRYPRTLEADLDVCAEEGVDVVFAPSVEDVYPGGDPVVTVDPGPLADVLEGATRPGHFAGVLTVVAKLLGLVRPDVAVFGEKDYQQLVLVRRMVTDLCLGTEIVGAPTVREADGLALSSRNRFLTPEQREQATALHRALDAAAAAAPRGVGPALAEAHARLREADGVDLDYLTLTDEALRDLTDEADRQGAAEAARPGRALVAARVGSTRLIDNVPLVVGQTPAPGATQTEPGPGLHPDLDPATNQGER